MSQVDDALASFAGGFNCAQSVFATFGPSLGMDREDCLRIAGTFGGGMGRMGEACGAVTGALMAIGLQYGQTDVTDKAGKDRCYALVREFITRFRARNGTINCTELLGFDLGTPEGAQAAKETSIHTTVCPKFVGDAAEILAELLARES